VPPSLQPAWVPTLGRPGDYTVQVLEFRVGGHTVGSPSDFSHSIVDSGTTFIYLPPTPYAAVRRLFQQSCPWPAGCASRSVKGHYPDDYCYTMEEADLGGFANHSIRLGGGFELPLTPRQYIYKDRPGVWCLGVFDNGHAGLVIGAAAMRGHEVVFDVDGRRIAFLPHNCDAMAAAKAPSLLTGGYGLAGCSKPLTPEPPLPPHLPPIPPRPPIHPPLPPHPPGWGTPLSTRIYQSVSSALQGLRESGRAGLAAAWSLFALPSGSDRTRRVFGILSAVLAVVFCCLTPLLYCALRMLFEELDTDPLLGLSARGRDGGAAAGTRAPPMLLSRQVRQGYDHLRQSEGLELAVMQSASGERF